MNTASLHKRLAELWILLPTLGRRFDARPIRERLMIALAVVAACVMVMDRLWLDRVYKRFRSQQAEQSVWNEQRQKLSSEMEGLTQELRMLQHAKTQQVQEVRKRLADAQAALHDQQQGVVSAQQMLPLLQQLLQRSSCAPAQGGCRGLRVRAVKSLGRSELTVHAVQQPSAAPPAERAMPSAQVPPPAAPSGPTLWRHGFEITLEGTYAELSAYVQTLEALPQRVLRGGMTFQVEAHPKATLTLTLYTLSLDHSWLEI